MKRKRKTRDLRDPKRQKLEEQASEPPTWSLLRQYYPQVLTLRHYLAAALRDSSKKGRKRILRYGQDGVESNEHVVRLLDSIVVGSTKPGSETGDEDLDKDITIFTQQVSESSLMISPTESGLKQSEIVDFVLWTLFRRHTGSYMPSHILCRGYQRYAATSNASDVPCVPGLLSNTPNAYVEALKKHPWSALPPLLGRNGERILATLLLDSGVFAPVADSSNLKQLSGRPLNELKPLHLQPKGEVERVDDGVNTGEESNTKKSAHNARGYSSIRFVRSRMLYAKPDLSSRGTIRFGLGHVHALNGGVKGSSERHAGTMLRYIFPRQFGLHNAFTSTTDSKDTAQPFKDYTIRDQEIARSIHKWRLERRYQEHIGPDAEPPLPKRLRGLPLQTMGRIIKRHSRCAYAAMLNHYCPQPLASNLDPQRSIAHASPPSHVSAFCRAAVMKVFPRDLWGPPEKRSQNMKTILRNVDRFIRLRRYESLTVHDIVQGIELADVEWLAPSSSNVATKMCATDFAKRKELMAELLYYIFDSFLIPLIRGHFHVTESGIHRNQLFFFRHEVWMALSEPALATLKATMLEECKTSIVKNNLTNRTLGVSRVRLLPKDHGMRPIINLRRRTPQMKKGQLVLGRSINSILAPTFSILNYEKEANSDVLASAMFAVNDMYPRLQSYRTSLKEQGLENQPLYFAKVDVRACFDTIPQQRLMAMVERVLSQEEYCVTKYARGKLIGRHNREAPGFGSKASWRYLTKATTCRKDFDFASEAAGDVAEGRTRSVYIDGVVQKSEEKQNIMALLQEHIGANLIKLGNRFYRQKEGIPQGSVVSSLLCSYFYAGMERELLGFINDGSSIMMRLIDDFLVISTKQDVAERFLRVMHNGVPEFGIDIKAEKSLVNFDVVLGGKQVNRLPAAVDFPYCGTSISTVTLDLSKDRDRRNKSNVQDSTSVEYSKIPGQSFYRKILNILKLQMQAMLLSTSYNSLSTVIANLHHSFTEVAQKCYHYIRSMPIAKQPGNKLVLRTIDDMIKVACVLMKRRKQSSKDVIPYECCLSAAQARWLACAAFRDVFRRRQTKYRELLRWVEGQIKAMEERKEVREARAILQMQ